MAHSRVRSIFPALLLSVAASAPTGAVVVESVQQGFAADRAGIAAGDVLVSWERSATKRHPDAARGRFDDPFDPALVELEHAPMAAVTISSLRDGVGRSCVVPPGTWGLVVRPPLSGGPLRSYRAAVERIEEGDADGAVDLVRELTTRVSDPLERAWAWFRTAALLAEAGARPQADAALAVSLEVAATADRPEVVAWLHVESGRVARVDTRFDDADGHFREALRLREKISPESLAVADALVERGRLAWLREDAATGRELWSRALAIQEKLAPRSLAVAATLNDLGKLLARSDRDPAAALEHHRRALAIQQELGADGLDLADTLNLLGDLRLYKDTRDESAAADYYRSALAIEERLAPDSYRLARTLHNLGTLADLRGELTEAEALYRRALEIARDRAPGSQGVEACLVNLGNVAVRRGRLSDAEEHYRRALAIAEAHAPGGVGAAVCLNNLGDVAEARGDLESAEDYYRRASRIFEARDPKGNAAMIGLRNIGLLLQARGDLDGAERYLGRALALRGDDLEALDGAPDRGVADVLYEMGSLSLLRGDLDAAESRLRRSLGMQEAFAPGGLWHARNLHRLGEVLERRGGLEAAQEHYRRALSIRETLAGGSAAEAESAHALGALLRDRGRRERALAHFRQAVDALEGQIGTFGGTEEQRAGFRARFSGHYRDLIEALLSAGRADEAFHVLERSRARSLLAMLAERDLVFTADLPEKLDRRRRNLAAEYDRHQRRLAGLSPRTDPAAIEDALQRLEALRKEQAEVVERIRRASPALASLRYPRPLDLAEARAALDPGAILLAYDVGEHDTLLFVVSRRTDLRVHRLRIGEAALRQAVGELRDAILAREPGRNAMLARARRLYETLVAPAERAVYAHSRVVIAPDGPLHLLPFAALVRPTTRDERRWGYLVEWKPLSLVLSATLLEELGKGRGGSARKASLPALVAFADPSRESGAEADAQADGQTVRALLRGDFDFPPLRSTRREVAAVAALFGDRSRVHVGKEATEARAKATGRGVRYLHFATHGFFDERLPLDSGLLLSVAGNAVDDGENGLLQAWEIFEQVRLDADLVVLSACETSLGRELRGEGLIGLARAFHYAGARSVVASLWNVADAKTAALMERFYRGLVRGRPKDEALRAAQTELLRKPVASAAPPGEAVEVDATHPFYWAGFVLTGDGR